MTEPVYLRDLDGTGSMHVCAKGDPGAIAYTAMSAASVDDAERLRKALRDACATIEHIQDEARVVCGDWSETASIIDSICIVALAKFDQRETSGTIADAELRRALEQADLAMTHAASVSGIPEHVKRRLVHAQDAARAALAAVKLEGVGEP